VASSSIAKRTKFTKLDQYLAQGKWQEADMETAKVMCKIMNAPYLNNDQCRNFPVEELKIIDDLWIKYSDGKFGFSVQKEIWLECGGLLGNHDSNSKIYSEIYPKFVKRLIWYLPKKGILPYSELSFHNTAPRGHLPIHRVHFEGGGYSMRYENILALFAKL
jgi:hypothetical protein